MFGKTVIEIVGDTEELNTMLKGVGMTNGYFKVGTTCAIVKSYNRDISRDVMDPELLTTTFECQVSAQLPKPQFRNGDKVYDVNNGNEYVYIGQDHIYGRASVICDPESEEYISVPTSEITTEKPVVPKEGEWWMCSCDNSVPDHPIQRKNGDWNSCVSQEHITPLYRMIRDTTEDIRHD